MIERRVIRVLTVNSKTFYFVDKGVQRGIVVDYFRLFEDDLNKKLAAEKQAQEQEPEGAGGVHPDARATSCCRRSSPARATSPPPTSRSRRNARSWSTSPRPA